MGVNVWAVLVSAVVAFVLSGAWYAGFGNLLPQLSSAYEHGGRTAPATIAVELARNLVVAMVLAGLAGLIDLGGWVEVARFGAALWVGFPAMILAGSVFHEKVPVKLAAIHAGDWLVKLLAVALIVGLWR